MNELIALTGITGAMGLEVISHLMSSSYKFKVRAIRFNKEKRIPKELKQILRKYKDRIEMFSGDISNYEDCLKLLKDSKYCIHCAAMIPPKSDHHKEQTRLSNQVGTENIVKAILELGNTIKLVNIATVALYGNRSYPHFYGSVGDPLISSDYDNYSMYKMKAERCVIESGLNNFVSLRQTGILHKYMFINNLKDGLMFHTSWNCCLEWVTDRDSGLMIEHLVEKDLENKLNGFWNNIYNIGGGKSCKATGYETFDRGFSQLGRNAKTFFKPNWNIPRNFHAMWYLDSDELNDWLDFRRESFDAYWNRMAKRYWYFSLGKIVPPKVISYFAFKKLYKKNTNAPMYWVEHNKEGRVKAFYGGREAYNSIKEDWSNTYLLSEGKLPDGSECDYASMKESNYPVEHGLLLDHGYDRTKKLEELTYEDLEKAAIFRGGHCLAKDYKPGDIRTKIKWVCHEGHEFEASVFAILRGGYWCPTCAEPSPWAYGKLAKNSPFFAQIYYDTHTKEEENDVYPLPNEDEDFIEYK